MHGDTGLSAKDAYQVVPRAMNRAGDVREGWSGAVVLPKEELRTVDPFLVGRSRAGAHARGSCTANTKRRARSVAEERETEFVSPKLVVVIGEPASAQLLIRQAGGRIAGSVLEWHRPFLIAGDPKGDRPDHLVKRLAIKRKRSAIVAAADRVANAKRTVGIEEDHVIDVGDGLFVSGAFDKHTRANKGEPRPGRKLLGPHSAIMGATANIFNLDRRTRVNRSGLKATRHEVIFAVSYERYKPDRAYGSGRNLSEAPQPRRNVQKAC